MPGTRRSLNGERVELRVLQTFTVAEPCAPEQFVHSINLPLSLLHFCSWGSKREILCFQVVGGNMLPSADGIPGDHLGAVFAAVPYLFVPMYFGGGRRERVSAPLPQNTKDLYPLFGRAFPFKPPHRWWAEADVRAQPLDPKWFSSYFSAQKGQNKF